MRILGIDPGLATTGIGLVEAENAHSIQPIEWLTICTPAGLETPLRLRELQCDLEKFLSEVNPMLAVVEKVYFAVNATSAIDVAQARGVMLAALAARGIPVIEASPLQLKLAITGDGKAEKRQVQQMLLSILKLQEIPRPDDAADALALAVYGALVGKSALLPQ